MEDWPPLAPQGGDRNKKNHQRYLRNKLEIDSLVILCVLSYLVVKMINSCY